MTVPPMRTVWSRVSKWKGLHDHTLWVPNQMRRHPAKVAVAFNVRGKLN